MLLRVGQSLLSHLYRALGSPVGLSRRQPNTEKIQISDVCYIERKPNKLLRYEG